MPTCRALLVTSDPQVDAFFQDPHSRKGLEELTLCRDVGAAFGAARTGSRNLAIVDTAVAEIDTVESMVREFAEDFGMGVILIVADDNELLRGTVAQHIHGFLFRPLSPGAWAAVRQLVVRRHRSDRLLATHRTQHEAILAHAYEGYWLSDVSGRLLEVNDAYCAMSGYSREELLRMNIADLTPQDERGTVAPLLDRIRAEGGARFERHHRRKDGCVLEVEVSATYLAIDGGRFVTFVRDVSARKDAERARRASEAAIRLSEARLSLAFQVSPVPMALTEFADGRLIEVNDAFLSAAGQSREEVIGRTSVEIGWMPAEARADLVRRLEQSTVVRDVEVAARTRNGTTLQVLYSGVVFEVNGRRLLLSTWRDVTAQRRDQARLQLQSAALAAAGDAIAIIDVSGCILIANDAFTAQTGYSPAEYTGRSLRELLHPDEPHSSVFAAIQRVVRRGEIWRGEMTNVRRDGSRYVDETAVTPVKNAHGEAEHFVVVKHDLTQRQMLEQQLRQAQKMEAIGQLAGGVAHDFNNILAAVMMYLGLLQDDSSVPELLRQMLRELQKEVKRGAGLTRQLLTFSRQEAMRVQAVDLDHLIAGFVKMLSRILGENI